MINLVYAIDENYNIQTSISIKSFLNKCKNPINVYIIHKNKITFDSFASKLSTDHKLNSISIYQFNNRNIEFPRIEDTHISEATYYRLYLDEYLPKNMENFIYVDGDVLCTNEPDIKFNNIFDSMKKEKFYLGAKTDEFREEENQDIDWDGILMKGNKYFNAGVLFINYKEWVSNDIFNKLQKRQVDIKDKLYFWDQDILNSFFDGNYLELEEKFNYRVGLDNSSQKYKETEENSILIHYQGSWKPWSIRGAFTENARFYHSYFSELGFGEYHLVHTWKLNSVLHLFIGLITFKLFKIEKPMIFLIECFKSLSKNKI
jgi:lipopolysaccharide biosynthesis glycosyltransferase